jgi:molybdopterin-binding protein
MRGGDDMRSVKGLKLNVGDTIEVTKGKYAGRVVKIVDLGVTTRVKIDIPLHPVPNPTATAWIPTTSIKVISQNSY